MSKEQLGDKLVKFRQHLALGYVNMDILNQAHEIHELVMEQAERVQKLEEEVDRYHISLWQELVLNHVLTEQNKRYREALEFINEELELVLHSNKGLAEKMFYIENSKRKITEVLEGESNE